MSNVEQSEEWIKNQQEGFKQTNQFAIEYSIKTIWSAFLINGAATTAILSSKIEKFYPAAMFFALGAILAVIAFGIAYIYILMLCETWRPNYGIRPYDAKIFNFNFYIFKARMSDKDVECARVYAILPVLASIIAFIVGLIICWCKL